MKEISDIEGTAAAEEPVDDPMNAMASELDDIHGGGAAQPNTQQRIRRKGVTGTARNHAVNVMMPEVCPEKDPTNELQREVLCYMKKHRQLFIALQDLSWLIQCLHDQHVSGGVSLNVAPPTSEGGGSASGLPGSGAERGLHDGCAATPVRWEFFQNAWRARKTTSDGREETRTLGPSDVTVAAVNEIGMPWSMPWTTAAAEAVAGMSYSEKKRLAPNALMFWVET